MINEGTSADEMWPDGWTAVTRDGKRSAQFEHTLLVTETGVEVLSARVGASTTGIVWDEAAIQRPLASAAAPAAATAADGAKTAAADASATPAPATGGAGVTATDAGAAAASDSPATSAAAGGSGTA